MNRIADRDEKALLLIYCLNEFYKTKAVILLKNWKSFSNDWKAKLKGREETLDYFLAFIRGLVTPYRDKYGMEAGICYDEEGDRTDKLDEVELTKTIIDRHYATIKFLIVSDPKKYKNITPKMSNERIMTIEDFHSFIMLNRYDI